MNVLPSLNFLCHIGVGTIGKLMSHSCLTVLAQTGQMTIILLSQSWTPMLMIPDRPKQIYSVYLFVVQQPFLLAEW